MAPIPGISCMGVGAGVTPAIVSLASTRSTATNSSSYSLTGMSFGAEATDRHLVAVGYILDEAANQNISVTSMTIGGSTATIHRQGGVKGSAFVASVKLTTGTSGTVVVNTSPSSTSIGLGLYRVTKRNTLEVIDSENSSASSPSVSLDVVNGGFILGAIGGFRTGTSYPAISGYAISSGATFVPDFNEKSQIYSGASTETGAKTYTGSYPTSDNVSNAMTLVSFR